MRYEGIPMLHGVWEWQGLGVQRGLKGKGDVVSTEFKATNEFVFLPINQPVTRSETRHVITKGPLSSKLL